MSARAGHGDGFEVAYVPLDRFLVHLARGWTFGGIVVQPIQGMPHGLYSCLMVREPADA
jgi:hypothetical protein